jgi:hypothetical protein
MTIRQEIYRKSHIANLLVFISLLVMVAYHILYGEKEWGYEIFIPLFVFLCAALYVRYFIKCPFCLTSIGGAVSQIGSPVNALTKKSICNFCPCCGVNFNDPV